MVLALHFLYWNLILRVILRNNNEIRCNNDRLPISILIVLNLFDIYSLRGLSDDLCIVTRNEICKNGNTQQHCGTCFVAIFVCTVPWLVLWAWWFSLLPFPCLLSFTTIQHTIYIFDMNFQMSLKVKIGPEFRNFKTWKLLLQFDQILYVNNREKKNYKLHYFPRFCRGSWRA